MKDHRRLPHRFHRVLTHALTAALVPAALLAADAPDASGHWEGAIELPAGELRVKVDLEQADGGWTGTIDIPQQGAKGLPLEGISIEGEAVKFAIQGVPGAPTFDGRLSDAGMAGSFTQGGAQLKFNLSREVAAPPARPQEPQPPFPYREEEVVYQNGDVTLAGTLTVPEGAGPHPAVLLLTGSGAQDRNETIFDHKPFWVIADHLTRAGVAVLRVDDRGVGGSSGNVGESTSADFADDALAGVRYLAAHAAIDGRRVGLLGHSEGGLVGPLAASRSDDVAFVVLLAGPGVPGDEILVRQLELIVRAGGADEETVGNVVQLQGELMATLKSGADEATLRAQLGEAIRRQTEAGGPALSEDDLEKAVEQQVGQLTSRWFRFFVSHDPRQALAEVSVPVLALNGGLDLQVDPRQNLPEIVRVLEAAGNKDVTARTLEGLNHLFQHATTGLVNEYGEIEETFAPEALEIITAWIVERFGTSTPP